MDHPLAFAIAMSHIAAAIALLNGVLTTLGQGNVAAHAVEAIGRQPEAKGSITTTMFIGCGFAETSGVYGLLIAFLLIFVNPLINNNLDRLVPVAQDIGSVVLSFLG
ncbi:MAG: ATP synthase F0 subunit C [Clostridiales bacterium]|jgi:F-type H+-transporting ATPase subunit c|nr:ATP synthase F0 subunit C [Clostridiales bacterium]